MADYYITATLLNNWQYYLNYEGNNQEEVKQSFLDCLNKIEIEPTKEMQRGKDYEDLIRTCDEKDLYSRKDNTINEITDIIKGGLWQEQVSKVIEVDNKQILLFGYADVIKQDKIYDIKRVNSYKLGKYYNSTQHKIYMLCTRILDFDYLISDSKEVFVESYSVSSIQELENEIKNKVYEFFTWLKITNLYDCYTEHWKSDEKEKLIETEIFNVR